MWNALNPANWSDEAKKAAVQLMGVAVVFISTVLLKQKPQAIDVTPKP